MTNQNLKDIVWVSFMAAIMVVLDVFVPSIPIILWLSLSFTVVPALILSLAIGPKHATVAIILTLSIKLLHGSATAGIGELANFIIWTSTVWAVGVFYRKSKIEKENKKTIIAFLIGALAWIIAAVLANIFVLIPLYARVMGWEIHILANMMADIFPGVNEYNFMFRYITLVTIPYAIMQTSLFFTITFLLHKRIRTLYLKV